MPLLHLAIAAGLAGVGNCWVDSATPHRLYRTSVVSARSGCKLGCCACGRNRLSERTATAAHDSAARPAGPAISLAAGYLVGFFSVAAGLGWSRHLDVCRRILSYGSRYRSRAALFAIPRISGKYGLSHIGRRCLLFHGGLGNDGIELVLSGYFPTSKPCNSPCGLCLCVDRAL